jgi:Flp pilus assembly protein TadG
MVLFALCMVVLLVLAGSAYDYGSIVVENAQLQNAVDAAVLAGADSLGRSA